MTTARPTGETDSYQARTEAGRAADHPAANGRPPVSMEFKTALLRQRAQLVKATAHLERARLA
ncbi:hypothetical protein [Streptomyces sp. NRRL F-2664]|uniref:hypothetical protein n=1 Tax=Streptomyces sp. NRRL F-2664 TaxID=1463842 RepID=UPI000AD9EAC5|nr:hypothetical protein [Streptomyces sp. NRRL F-2664]